MLVIFLILFSFVYTVPRRYNYNCFKMHAELFPVEKVFRSYSNQSHDIRSKCFEQLIANMPAYQKKINDTESEIAASINQDLAKIPAEYLAFKNLLLNRDNQMNFNESPEDDFRDKMRLRVYNDRLNGTVAKTFGISYDEPVKWLDKSHLVYDFINSSVTLNYNQSNPFRIRSFTPTEDHCVKLGQSLRNDTGWNRGTAKNAYELVLRCYNVFPYNDDAAKKIYDLSLLMMEFYVFSNLSTQGVGSSFIYREMKDQELRFDSSLHFHTYFDRVLSRMNDAHISYSVNCYEQFSFIQPVYLQHLNDNNHTGFYVAKVDIPELDQWIGSHVVAIDAISPFYKIYNYGNEVGKSHNSYTRYTLGLSRLFFESTLQKFRFDRGLYLKRSKIPDRSYLVYTLRKPGAAKDIEVKINWMVFATPTLVKFKDQYSYWNKNCEAKPLKQIVKAANTTLQRRSSGTLKPFTNNIKRRSRLQKRSDTTTNIATIDGMIPIAVGPGFAFFTLYDSTYGDCGILIIQTFDVQDADSWFKNMYIGFKAFKDKGITRLLLDLTGNSGGTLCLAYTLLGVLSPSKIYPFPATEFTYGTRTVPTDGLKKISACVDEAKIKSSPFDIHSFTNMETRINFPKGYNWGSESEAKPNLYRGLMYSYTQFSPFLIDKCQTKNTYHLEDINPKFKTIILVSDGLCGSSCAIVISYLQQHGSPAILLSRYWGGGTPPNLYSFAGGQVVNSNNIKDVAKRSSCFGMVPDVLETTLMTITYRAIFNIDDKKNPLEYKALPAHHVFDYTTIHANSYAARWKSFFPKGMDIFNNPDNYTQSNSEELGFCLLNSFFC